MTDMGNRSRLEEHLGLLSVLIGILVCICEALIHVLVSHKSDLISEILTPDIHEIAVRVIFLAVIIFMGVLSQKLISSRRKVEETLRESEAKFRVIFDTLTDIVFSLDSQGRLTYLNPQFEKITGYRNEDLYGHPYIEIIHPDCRELTQDMFRRGISGQDTPMYEMDIIAADGSRIPIEVNAKTVLDNSSRPIGRIGIARDMRQRMEVEMDQGQVEQVLLDLYVNAWHAVPMGSYTIMKGLSVCTAN
jgi:PAS domain S-box-containing protein